MTCHLTPVTLFGLLALTVTFNVNAEVEVLDDQALESSWYGQKTAEWWQYLYADDSRLRGHGEVDCQTGQQGRTWYLAGTGDAWVERECQIRPGKYLLIPLLNDTFLSCPGEINPDTGQAYTVEEKRGVLSDVIDLNCGLEFTIDGQTQVAVRTQSVVFPLHIKAGKMTPLRRLTGHAFCDSQGVMDTQAVAEGIWGVIPPFENNSSHIVHVRGATCDPDTGDEFFSTEVTYTLTVRN